MSITYTLEETQQMVSAEIFSWTDAHKEELRAQWEAQDADPDFYHYIGQVAVSTVVARLNEQNAQYETTE